MISKKQATYGGFILLIAMIIGSGILWFGKAQAKSGSLGYHALKINGNFVSEAVFREEQNKFFQRWHRTASMLRKSDEERQDLLVDTIIDRVVMEEFLLKRSGIQVGPQEIESYLDQFIKTKYATESEFHEYLDSISCEGEEDLKKIIQIYLVKLKCLPGIALQYGVQASQTEIERAYQRQKRENWSVVLQHILLSPQKTGGFQSQWKLASEISGQLEKGADFATLARKYSGDPETQSKGGLLEPLTKEKVPPAFAARIFDAKPGEVIPPFLTNYGIEILKVLKLNGFYHSRDEIADILVVEKFEKSPRFRDWLTKVKGTMKIEITDPALAAYGAFKNQKYQTAAGLYFKAYRRYQQEFYFYRAFQSCRAAGNWGQVVYLSQAGIKKFGMKVPYYIYGAEGLCHMKKRSQALKLLKTALALSVDNVVEKEQTLQMYNELGFGKEAGR